MAHASALRIPPNVGVLTVFNSLRLQVQVEKFAMPGRQEAFSDTTAGRNGGCATEARSFSGSVNEGRISVAAAAPEIGCGSHVRYCGTVATA